MPELPEVETVRRGLEELLPGREIREVTIIWEKSLQASQADINKYIIGSSVLSVERRGKMLEVKLSSQYSLVVHLKMTGQLVYRGKQNFGAGHPNDSLVGELPDRTTRIIFSFKDGSRLFFNDQRKFGWIRLVRTNLLESQPYIKKLGPEPLEPSFTADDFLARLKRRNNSAIKAVLLDQSVVVGIGNIYADESLFLAKLHPKKRVKDISRTKLIALFKAVNTVLQQGISSGGSSDRNYVDASGNKGQYLDFAKVFRREGKICFNCGATIIKIRVAGRGTHLCPYEQKLPKDYK